ncbi:hypothetical protein TRFO_00906 [Tritrichomonas foetus]|uniref:Uncharacterized protein n=1 Tax=Tritrichomonas foetus TaxID=1144522 RepID=A0A1J4L2J3_9EUKA|nr:hypothetical protein TRFO_00906 [Tritrichomonas foetus]|eukprot:OHT17634.1 hypothetical protein TRFO_00906 [Tritrichomonas foetus]
MINSFFIISLLSLNCKETIQPKLGINNYTFDANENDIICIEPKIYPVYILFSEFPSDTLLEKYIYNPNNNTHLLDFSALLRYLPIYDYSLSPSTRTILKTQSNGSISLTTSVFPGMCSNGIFFSNSEKFDLSFSERSFGFWKINNYDDKCIIFSASKIKMEINSNDDEDQFFLYSDFDNFTSISGNNTLMIDDIERNYLVRFVADDSNIPNHVSLSFEGCSTCNNKNDMYLPQFLIEKCSNHKKWYGNNIAIVLIILLFAFVLLFLYTLSMEWSKEMKSDSCDSISNRDDMINITDQASDTDDMLPRQFLSLDNLHT